MFTLKFHLMIYYPTLDCCSTGTNTPDCTSCVCHWSSSLLYSRKNQNTQLFQQLDLLKEGVWKGLVLYVHAKISFTEIFPQLLVLKYVVASLKPGPQQ